MLKVHLKPVKVLERVYICGVTQFKGSEKFDERFLGFRMFTALSKYGFQGRV